MKLTSFETIVRALNGAGVRYLVAGGLAVTAHGYLRFTNDVDIVLALDNDNIPAAFEALAVIGYRPTVPVTAEQFADPATRQRWIDEKGMTVLNFFSDTHRETPLDIFVKPVFDFEDEYAAALQGEILPGIEARFVSIPTLITMKRGTGRAKDEDDIQHLQWLLEERRDEGE